MDRLDPHEEWGDPTILHPNWVGSAALVATLSNSGDIYGITGIDSDEWQIVGLDLSASQGLNPYALKVIAVRVSELGGKHIEAVDSIRAARFDVYGVEPFELLRKMAHNLNIRFRVAAAKDAAITVTEMGVLMLES